MHSSTICAGCRFEMFSDKILRQSLHTNQETTGNNARETNSNLYNCGEDDWWALNPVSNKCSRLLHYATPNKLMSVIAHSFTRLGRMRALNTHF